MEQDTATLPAEAQFLPEIPAPPTGLHLATELFPLPVLQQAAEEPFTASLQVTLQGRPFPAQVLPAEVHLPSAEAVHPHAPAEDTLLQAVQAEDTPLPATHALAEAATQAAAVLPEAVILAAAAHVQEDLLPEGKCTAKRKQKV